MWKSVLGCGKCVRVGVEGNVERGGVCEKMLGEVWESLLGCGEDKGKDVGVWKSVLSRRGRCGEVSGEE